jgi:hypothetical protein
MTSIRDLPLPAVKRILQLARGRVISGTNGHLCVCRQWRDAGGSEDLEPLQLLLEWPHLSESELSKAIDWMSVHGHQLGTLVVVSQGCTLQQLQSLFLPAASFTNLRRLEVDHQHSLDLLAPVLGQLPQLQHLAMALSMAPDFTHEEGIPPPGHLVDAGFINSDGQHWDAEVPDLEELCPHLTSLHLTFVADTVMYFMEVEVRLILLLPDHLERLVLSHGSEEGAASTDFYMVVLSNTFSHLTALRELDLIRVGVGMMHPGTLAQDLPALQQLRVQEPHRAFVSVHDPLLHGPPVTSYKTSYMNAPWLGLGKVAALVHLTELTLSWAYEMPESMAGTIATLTGLQSLRLHTHAIPNTVACIQQAAAMPKLRHLDLYLTAHTNTALSAALAACTQLTSLSLSLSYLPSRPPGLGSVQMPDDAPVVDAVQQLVGLRCLTVRAGVLEQGAGAWLAPLTALTRLGVIQLHRSRAESDVQSAVMAAGHFSVGPHTQQHWCRMVACRLLESVQVWPPGLQQVVLLGWGAGCHGVQGAIKPSGWVHTPSDAGAAPLNVWLERESEALPAWPRPWHPCPHLPGVWELPSREGQGNG